MPKTDSSLSVMAGFLEEIIAQVIDTSNTSGPPSPLVAEILEDPTSLESSRSPSFPPPAHPLPCSQDFLFFKAIAESQVQLFPDSQTSSTSPGLTPPWQLELSPSPGMQPEVLNWAEDDEPQWPQVNSEESRLDMKVLVFKEQIPAITQYSQESLVNQLAEDDQSQVFMKKCPAIAPSCGVALMPMSQASQTSSDEEIISQEELPASKRIRMEDTSPEQFQDLKDEDMEENTMLPLTFNSKVDLLWKLQRADLLPGLNAEEKDRPCHSKDENRQKVNIKQEESLSVVSLMDGMKPQVSRHSLVKEEGDLEPYQKDKFSGVFEEGGIDPYQEEGPFYPPGPGKPAPSPPAKARASLLHRAPRVGLSKLHRVPSIHEITFIKGEE